MIKEQNIPYYGIDSGKLRRYFDWKNFSDPLRVIHGYAQAKKILSRLKPDVVFSKGGFVSVPVVRAASALHIRTIIHESDMTPGLANRLAIPAADKVCCSFPETLKYLPEGKAVLSGSPIRQELLTGERGKALELLHWDNSSKPTLLVIGGSQGSVAINNALRSDLDELLKEFRIIHLCGKILRLHSIGVFTPVVYLVVFKNQNSLRHPVQRSFHPGSRPASASAAGRPPV